MASNTNTLAIEHIDSWTTNILKEEMKATDEELIYFDKLQQLRYQKWEHFPDVDGENPSVVIDDFLYHGDIGHASNVSLLIKLGIRHIVNTCDESLKTEITHNFNVLWISIDDDLRANINQYFQQTNDFLFSCKQKKEKVLVHCQMGISRSSSIVLAYLMKYHHDTLIKAYKYLLDRRPQSLPNSGFLLQLIRYEKVLRNSGAIDEQRNDDDKQNPIKPIQIPSNFSVEKPLL
ncbi:unnamed protein product [Rotaria sp. Silwood2]|nr:unnamed protein product [Rotaria sp. Silwood2]CAF4478088.1 unnamed protein product [Rotaria sp. Silwood2]